VRSLLIGMALGVPAVALSHYVGVAWVLGLLAAGTVVVVVVTEYTSKAAERGFVPLSVRHGSRSLKFFWWWAGRREALALRLAPWLQSAQAVSPVYVVIGWDEMPRAVFSDHAAAYGFVLAQPDYERRERNEDGTGHDTYPFIEPYEVRRR
jgi:hypothetical protein